MLWGRRMVKEKTEQIVIGEIEKNSYQTIKATIQEYKGKRFADFRVYFEKDGEQHPTKKGIAVALDSVGDFSYLVDKTLRYIEEEENKNQKTKKE